MDTNLAEQWDTDTEWDANWNAIVGMAGLFVWLQIQQGQPEHFFLHGREFMDLIGKPLPTHFGCRVSWDTLNTAGLDLPGNWPIGQQCLCVECLLAETFPEDAESTMQILLREIFPQQCSAKQANGMLTPLAESVECLTDTDRDQVVYQLSIPV